MIKHNYNDIYDNFQTQCCEMQTQNLDPQEMYCKVITLMTNTFEDIYNRLFETLLDESKSLKGTVPNTADCVAEIVYGSHFTGLEQTAIVMHNRDSNDGYYEYAAEMMLQELIENLK